MLRTMGATPEAAILATSMFYFGAIAAAFLSAAMIGRYGIERVLAVMLLLGGVCIMVTGVAALSAVSLSLFILGFGFGTGGSQLGISALPGAIYPTAIRSTGAGWAPGIGRLGNVAGALLGGALLGLGWSPQKMLLTLGAAPLVNSILMWALGRMRASRRTQIAATFLERPGWETPPGFGLTSAPAGLSRASAKRAQTRSGIRRLRVGVAVPRTCMRRRSVSRPA